MWDGAGGAQRGEGTARAVCTDPSARGEPSDPCVPMTSRLLLLRHRSTGCHTRTTRRPEKRIGPHVSDISPGGVTRRHPTTQKCIRAHECPVCDRGQGDSRGGWPPWPPSLSPRPLPRTIPRRRGAVYARLRLPRATGPNSCPQTTGTTGGRRGTAAQRTALIIHTIADMAAAFLGLWIVLYLLDANQGNVFVQSVQSVQGLDGLARLVGAGHLHRGHRGAARRPQLRPACRDLSARRTSGRRAGMPPLTTSGVPLRASPCDACVKTPASSRDAARHPHLPVQVHDAPHGGAPAQLGRVAHQFRAQGGPEAARSARRPHRG